MEFPQNQLDKYLTGQSLYISPEVFQAIQERNALVLNQVDETKADVFSLGLSFLTAGLLMDVTDIYSKGKDKMDQDKLRNYLRMFYQRYRQNPLICKVLENMLQVEPLIRPSFLDIQTALPSFEQIKNYFNGQEKSKRPMNVAKKEHSSLTTYVDENRNNSSPYYHNDI